jgi:Secretion system C-terminal sorting domain
MFSSISFNSTAQESAATVKDIEGNVYEDNEYKLYGFSVRCISNTTAPNSIYNFLNIDESILYPNPATERLYVKNSNYANATIMIFNLQGKQVLTKKIDLESVVISNLRQGIYIAKVVCPENIMITKFIKE